MMAAGPRPASLLLSLLAALGMGGLMAWLFSREGTLGLWQWESEWRLVIQVLAALGALPLVLALAGIMARLLDRKAATVLAWVSLAFAVLAISAAATLFVYLRQSSHELDASRPAPALVDPASGIAPGADGIVRISLSSDPHWGSASSDTKARASVLAAIARARPRRDALIILGDNVEMGMENRPWIEELRDLSSALPSIPLAALMGNHDALIDGQFHYLSYLFPGGARTDSGSPFYYSMDAGAARIIVLELLWGSESFGRRQEAWLEKTLAGLPPGTMAIVLSHCFFYSSGYTDAATLMPWYDNRGTIERVSPILERHHVELVVSGHNHYMELLEHGGTSYAVVGSMGGRPDPEPSHVSQASKWFSRGVFGRLDLDIGARGIALAFRDEGGALLHEAFIPAAGR